MVAGDAVDAALHGIDEQSALEGCGGDASREILFGRERLLARFVGDEFDGPEQADAAHVSYGFLISQCLQSLFELCGRCAGAGGVGGFDQVFFFQIAQYGAAGGERNGMRVVGEAVQERAGSVGDRVDDFLAGDDCAERGVSAGESFGGDEDVGGNAGIVSKPVLNREVAAGAAHAGHDFVGDEEHAVAVADFGDRLQVSGWGNDCAEGGSADGFENEGGGFAVGVFYGAFEFGGVLLAAVAAAVSAIEVAPVAVGHADVRELFHHRQVDFAAAAVA